MCGPSVKFIVSRQGGAHLVDLSVDPPSNDEVSHLLVEEGRADIKRGGHAVNGDALVALKKLEVWEGEFRWMSKLN